MPETIETQRTATATLAHLYRMHNILFNNTLADISEQNARTRHHPEANSIYWIAGHLLDTRMYISRTLGLGLPQPAWVGKFSKGNKPDENEPPSLSEIME